MKSFKILLLVNVDLVFNILFKKKILFCFKISLNIYKIVSYFL